MEKPENSIIKKAKYELCLYISGTSPNSLRAINNVSAICEKYLKGNCNLEIIDVYQEGLLAQNEQLVALPLLVKKAHCLKQNLLEICQ